MHAGDVCATFARPEKRLRDTYSHDFDDSRWEPWEKDIFTTMSCWGAQGGIRRDFPNSGLSAVGLVDDPGGSLWID